jgi:hypothetical protein
MPQFCRTHATMNCSTGLLSRPQKIVTGDGSAKEPKYQWTKCEYHQSDGQGMPLGFVEQSQLEGVKGKLKNEIARF